MCHLHSSHSLDRVLIGCTCNSCGATFDLDVVYDLEEGSLGREQQTPFICRIHCRCNSQALRNVRDFGCQVVSWFGCFSGIFKDCLTQFQSTDLGRYLFIW